MVGLAALFRCTVEALETGEGLCMPASPCQGKPDSAPELPKMLGLPARNAGSAALMDLKDGSIRSTSATEAGRKLSQAIKARRKVWVVLD